MTCAQIKSLINRILDVVAFDLPVYGYDPASKPVQKQTARQ